MLLVPLEDQEKQEKGDFENNVCSVGLSSCRFLCYRSREHESMSSRTICSAIMLAFLCTSTLAHPNMQSSAISTAFSARLLRLQGGLSAAAPGRSERDPDELCKKLKQATLKARECRATFEDG